MKKTSILHHPPILSKHYFKRMFILYTKRGEKVTKCFEEIIESVLRIKKILKEEEETNYPLINAGIRDFIFENLQEKNKVFLATVVDFFSTVESVLEVNEFLQSHLKSKLVIKLDSFSELHDLFFNFKKHFNPEAFFSYLGLENHYSDLMFLIISKISEVDQILSDLEKANKQLHSKIEGWVETQRSLALSTGIENPKPTTMEKTETLYHASVDAANIFRKGFDEKIPEIKGLGGDQKNRANNPTISFTSSLYVAKEVARCLKEATLIAQGKVKVTHVFEWSRKEKIQDRIWKILGKEKLDFSKPENVMKIYRYYLELSSRYNPLFFGDMEDLMRKLKRVDYKNIGVLVCVVDMSDSNMSHFTSMYEYRVSPNHVLSIKKVIR